MLPLTGGHGASRALIEALPVLQRLALSYASATAHAPTLALLALDTRLAGVVRAAREPMIGQIRLAWWREQFRSPAARWPEGEPLLAALRVWQDHRGALEGLVDGWEELTAPLPLAPASMTAFAEARGRAFAALAELLGVAADSREAHRAGTHWALADLAGRLGDPAERAEALDLVRCGEPQRPRLSRWMRPLVVLHGVAIRSLQSGSAPGNIAPTAALTALRLGLLGR